MRLGLSLPILAEETLPSFVSHVAQRNGSRHVQDFVEDMGLSWRRILQCDPDTVLALADLTGVDAERLAADSFAPVGNGLFRFRGHNLPRSFLDRSALKFCPICVKADRASYGRSCGRGLWQIDPLRTCPDHAVTLGALDAAGYPRCPHDFAGRVADHRVRLDKEAVVSAGVEAARFARYLSARLLSQSCDDNHYWLDDLPIDVAARLCENVGTLVNTGPGARPGALDRKYLVAAGGSGFAICAQGPDALRQLYDDMRRSSPGTRGGFYADFGFYTRWLQRLTQPDRSRPIIDHFREFVLESYPLAPGQELLGKISTEKRWFSWAELGRKYQLSSGRIIRFQRAVGVADDDLRRVVPGAYDAELAALSRGLDRKAVARRLMVHPSTVDALLQIGLINHCIALPNLEKLFLPEEVDAFLIAITASAEAVDKAPLGSFPVPVICNKAKIKSADLFTALIAGKFRTVSRLRDLEGLPGLLLDLVEVLDHFEGPELLGLRRSELRTELHINSSTVGLLLGNGMIASTEVRDPRTRRPLSLVTRKELDRFLAKYLPLGLMAHALGTQAKYVAAKLGKAEVWPICLPAHCSKIYLREEASAIVAI